MNVASTAQDRKKALSLKSHVRVISSHQPVRVSELSGDKRSSYDSSKSQTPGNSSRESSGSNGVESSLMTDNFKELLLEPVDVQLLKLLGPDAEDFLHPTFRDGAKKTLNPIVVQRKCKYAWVRACLCMQINRARKVEFLLQVATRVEICFIKSCFQVIYQTQKCVVYHIPDTEKRD